MNVRMIVLSAVVASAAAVNFAAVPSQNVSGAYWWMTGDEVATRDENSQFAPSAATVTDTQKTATFEAQPLVGRKVTGWGCASTAGFDGKVSSFTMLPEKGDSCTWTKDDTYGAGVLLGLQLDWISYRLVYEGGATEQHLYTDSLTIAPCSLSKTGYTFETWTNAAGKAFDAGAVKSGSDFNITSHDDNARVELHPKWRANGYTLNYELGGGTAAGTYPSRATYDSAFTIADPIRTGYGLSEWTITPKPADGAEVGRVAGGTRFKNLSPNDGDAFTLTAAWFNRKYQVSFNNHGASTGRTEPLTVTYDEAYGALNVPQKENYTFLGYFTEEKAGEMIWDELGQPVQGVWKIASDVTVHAHWKAEEFFLEYDPNEGSGTIKALYVTNGVPTVLSDGSGFTRSGCTFMGWSETKTGSVQYAPGATVTFTKKVQLLYAVWEIPYYIAFDGHRATGGRMSVQKCLRNEETYLSKNTYSRRGYSFMGWADSEAEADQLKVTHQDGVAVKNLSDVPGATVTLFAVWKTNTYTVVFDPGRGQGEPMKPMEFIYDQANALPPCTYERPSYMHTFAGWENPLDGSIIPEGATVSNLCETAGGTNTLKAIWSLDVGDVSRALHCTTLVWGIDSVEVGESSGRWEIQPDGVGVAQKGGGTPGVEQLQKNRKDWLRATVETNGVLSFCYKLENTSGNAILEVSFSGIYERRYEEGAYGYPIEVTLVTNEWNSITIPVAIAEGEKSVTISLVLNSPGYAGYDDSVIIDKMLWEPEGGGIVPPDEPRVPTNMPQAITGLRYNGSEQVGVPSGGGYWITGNVGTLPGDYVATATPLYGFCWPDETTNAVDIAWSIGKGIKELGSVTFPDGVYTYDGTSHMISIEGKVSPGITVTYTGDPRKRIAAGTNEVTAVFTVAEPDLYEASVTSMVARLIVKRARKDVDYVTLEDKVVVYDGTSHSIAVTNDLPEGVELVYSPNDATNRVEAGTNEVTVTFKLADPDNYEPITKELKARLIVLKADKDVSGVTFPDAEFQYDGLPHSFGVVGEIPDGVEVVYDGATNRTEAGTNVVTASFRVSDTNNWNEITNTLTAALVIIPLPPGLLDNELHPGGTIGAFTAQSAVTYNGWLREIATSNIVGTITVKTTAAKSGKPCKVTIYVTPIGGKKKTFKTSFVPGEGRITDIYGIIYGATGLAGTFCDGVVIPEPLVVEAAKDFSKSKIDEEKALTGDYPVGCYTVALGTGEGQTNGFDCLSVTVAKKTGKAKVTGTLDDGTKFSLSCQGVLGQSFAVPVVLSGKKNAAKEPVSFGLVVWIEPSSRAVSVSGLQGNRWPGGPYLANELVAQPAEREYRFGFDLPAYHDYLTVVDGFAVAPTDAVYRVTGKKWDAGKTVGSVKVDKATGVPYVQYKSETQVPANLPKLKFSYTPKTGVVKGSFKLYYRLDGKLKTDSAAITGIAVDAVLRGNAVIKVNKKKEHFPLWSEIPVSP